MTLIEIYRIALTEGLSARQAAERFGVNHQSLAKVKTKHNMPTLRNEWDVRAEKSMLKMTNEQLQAYYNILCIPKNTRRYSREFKVCKELIEKNVLRIS